MEGLLLSYMDPVIISVILNIQLFHMIYNDQVGFYLNRRYLFMWTISEGINILRGDEGRKLPLKGSLF